MLTESHTRIDERKKKKEREKLGKSFWKRKKDKERDDNTDKKSDKTPIDSSQNMSVVIQYLQDETGSKCDKEDMREKNIHNTLIRHHPCVYVYRSEKKIGNNRKKCHLSSYNCTFSIPFWIGNRSKKVGPKYRKRSSNKRHYRERKRVHSISRSNSGLTRKITRNIKHVSKYE